MNYLKVAGLCVLFVTLGSCSGSSTQSPGTSVPESSIPNPETPESPEGGVAEVTGPDIYLLIGQSNMQGWGVIDTESVTGTEVDNARILQLNVSANPSIDDTFTLDDFLEVYPPSSVAPLVVARDPLHEPEDPVTGVKSERFISIGLSFARAASDYYNRNVVLVPAAMEGSGFCDNPLLGVSWNVRLPTNPVFGNDWLFQRAVKRTNAAIDESGGVLRGIIWHQGESDSGSFVCANAYQENLVQLAEDLRTEIKPDSQGAAFRGPDAMVPFVVGTMSRGSDSRGDLSVFSEPKSVVDTAHRLIGESLSYAGFANGDDLVPPAYPCGAVSCIHYGAEALRELGVRYFDEFLRIESAMDNGQQ